MVVKVKNVPTGTAQILLSLPSNEERVNSAVAPCTRTAIREVTCPVPTGATTLTMHFNAQLPGKSGDADRNGLRATAGTTTVSTQITFP